MKKYILYVIVIMLSLMSLSACGGEGKNQSDYFVIETTEITLATPELSRDWRLLGTHFLNGETIQIWGQNVLSEQYQGNWDVYVYREDGSSEFQFGGIKSKYRDGWYMDEDGCFYIAIGSELIKLDSEGNEVFHHTLDRTIKSLYQDKKGNQMVVCETEGGALVTSRLDGQTGELTDVDSIVLEEKESYYYLSCQANDIYMLDKLGVWKLNQQDDTKEAVISFVETSYTLDYSPESFQVTDDGAAEILMSGKKLTLKRVNMADARKILTMCSFVDMPNVEEALINFNKANDTYYVVWQQPEGNQNTLAYKEKLNVEIATGGGPDLMFVGNTIAPANVWDYVEKGVFMELNSYMEQAGINEENYYPLAFNGLVDGESVYGITLFAELSGTWVTTELFEGTEKPTMEEFVDALLAYEKDAVLVNNMSSENLPNMLFYASESLHGAVDWEKGICDFKNELFKKILQVCKRYGDDRKNDYPALTGRMNSGLYSYVSEEKSLEKGQIPVWNFFDDGWYPGGRIMYTVAINSNTQYSEGAWEVLEYLLNGELQSTVDDTYVLLPVKRSGLDDVIRKEMEEGSLLYNLDSNAKPFIRAKAGAEGYDSMVSLVEDRENYRAMHDITEEKAEKFRQMMETAKTMPVRQQAILNIVMEEAASYFAGSKSLDEVCALIQNRVQLYLDEKIDD